LRSYFLHLDNSINPIEKEILEKSRVHAKTAGLALNSEPKLLEMTVKALAANQKLHGKPYCPCRALTGDFPPCRTRK